MKTQIVTLATLFFIQLTVLTNLSGQSTMQSHLTLQSMTGKILPANDVITSDKDVIVVFWNSNNPRHFDYLDELNDKYLYTNDGNEHMIIAVSTDKYHIPQKLSAMVAGQGWDFDVYIDVNQSFSRMYSVCDEQLQTFIFQQGKKKVIEIELPELLPSDFLANGPITGPVL